MAAAFETTFTWITTGAQMGMGFVLPFALVFVAIPLETFVHSLRTVIGVVTAWALQGLAFIFHLMGGVFNNAGQMLGEFYDMVIVLPNRVGQKFNFGYADLGQADSGKADLSAPGFGKVDFGNTEIDAAEESNVGDVDGAARLSDSLVARGRKQVDLAEQGEWN